MQSIEGPYYFADREIDSPLMNAAGSINGTSEEEIVQRVEELTRTGIGAIKVGSFTIPEQAGAGIFYREDTETYNRMGLPNIGREKALKLINKLAHLAQEKGKLLVASISPTEAPEYGDSLEQAKTLVYDFLQTPADAVEVNTSCPHISDSEGKTVPVWGYDLRAMDDLTIDFLHEFGPDEHRRLLIKVPPELRTHHKDWLGIKIPGYLEDMEKSWLPTLADYIKERKVFHTIVASNTIPNQRVVEDQMTSLSGSSQRVKIIAREQLNNWKIYLDDEIEVISSVGVDSGREMAYRLRLGAIAVEGVSFLWRPDKMTGDQPMAWGERVTELLEEFEKEINLDREGGTS